MQMIYQKPAYFQPHETIYQQKLPLLMKITVTHYPPLKKHKQSS